MDWNAIIQDKPAAELTSVAYWDAENQQEGVFTFPISTVVVNADKTNLAIINDDQKVVLWLVNHPNSKFPEAITPGEKFIRAALKTMSTEEATPDQVVAWLNDTENLTFVYDSNQRVLKFGVRTE